MKRRQVVCAGLEAGVFKEFPERICDRSLRPADSATCFERPCSKWFTTSWSQVRSRYDQFTRLSILCFKIEEFSLESPTHLTQDILYRVLSSNCKRQLYSVHKIVCMISLLVLWVWMLLCVLQCSKTCGIGVRVREVKCYQGEELGHSCDSTLRPEARQSCEVQPCTTEAPGTQRTVIEGSINRYIH